VRALKDEASRVEAIAAIPNRTNPGPGGFYDSFGDSGSEKRIVNHVRWEDDPGSLASPRISVGYEIDSLEDAEVPLAWKKQARTLYESPLRIAYSNLDPTTDYVVRATYPGKAGIVMSLTANGNFVISDRVESGQPVVQEYVVPKEVIKGGTLELVWKCGEGQSGCEVAEVWLSEASEKFIRIPPSHGGIR